ncbi:cytochrome P450 [Paenibacillus flagellatus]|uniref:Cytochrome P450 n=1 Tax=Paenibacillus flagellatus TaxID=2211139 RepID=A0A2V5K3H9_9BACL|nr:cytochrome P450 [Paenibacillus flagellatus]PYI53809.1 cytochrome P450 [Paenibacillus flagellatus]
MTTSNTNVPGPKPIPVLGNLLEMGANPLRFFETCARTYGPVVKLELEKGRDTYLLSRPEHVQFVLTNTQKLFVKGYQRDRILSLVLGNGLVTSEGSFWLRQRRLSQPAFHQHRIEGYAAVMSAYAQRMLAGWRKDEVRDVHADMMRCTMEIVGKTLFDVDLYDPGEGSNEVAESMDRVFREYVKQYASVVRRLLETVPFPLPLPGNARLKRSVEKLDRIVYGIIERRREENRDRGDLLSMLLQARDDDGTGMTGEQLRDEAMTLFLAGHETTANVLSWTLYALARHPAAGEVLAAELDRVLEGREPAFADIPRLPYTQAVIKESMRLYPPVWFISREPVEDVSIDGYRLPAGCEVALSQWVMHRHPDHFADPQSFRPDRWSPSFEKSLPAYVYFPFGAGPRVCIGSGFAMTEATLLLASIAQTYRFEPADGREAVLEPSITLRPRYGIRLRAIRRR